MLHIQAHAYDEEIFIRGNAIVHIVAGSKKMNCTRNDGMRHDLGCARSHISSIGHIASSSIGSSFFLSINSVDSPAINRKTRGFLK